jgi:hypothetical protein
MQEQSIALCGAEAPLDALNRLFTLATPMLAAQGFEVEARGEDWAHWTRGFHSVVRAYAFLNAAGGGVRLHWQGDVPRELVHDVATRVANDTGWTQI